MTTPIIRLELEGMRHSVLHAFMAHNTEIEGYVGEALKKTIENYNFLEEVRRFANAELHEAVKRAVVNAIGDILYNKDVQHAIKEAVIKALGIPEPT